MSKFNKNYNDANSSNWYAIISGYEDIVFKLVRCPIPNISLGSITVGTSENVDIKIAGDKMIFDEPVLEFYVDEGYDNYLLFVEHMFHNSQNTDKQYFDIDIHLLDNHKNFIKKRFTLVDAFVNNLSELDLENNDEETNMKCTATIVFTEFKRGE